MRLYFDTVLEQKKSQLFWIILPIAVCILIMLPRLISPQFGMLDDGNTLTTASHIVSGDLSLNYEAIRGRFRPMYWLVPALIYRLVGANPFWFFFANLIFLILLLVFSTAFLRRLGVSTKNAALMGILFLLTGSTIENIYTLSKGELLMLLFILIALYTSVQLNSVGISKKTWIWRTLLATFLFFLAAINKETALVILPITGAWLIIEVIIARLQHRSSRWQWLGSLFISSLIGFAIYWLVRNSLVDTSLQGGTYTSGYNFSLDVMKASLIRWAGWLIRNDLYLLPLILFWVIGSLSNKKFLQMDNIALILIWVMGWITVYLPWRFAQEYYLLPFDLGIAIFTVLLFNLGWSSLRESSKTVRFVAGATLAVAAILWLASLSNYWTDARIQMAVDSANQQMLDKMEQLPEDASVLLNIQYPNEYTVELDLLLRQVGGRTDIRLETFNPSKQQTADYFLTPYVLNRPLLTVRMGVSELELTSWVSSLQNYLGDTARPIMQVEQSLPLAMIDLPRLFCPLIPTLNFCATSRPLIDTRTFVYGWMLYPAEP
jgi:hypothetical protein